MAFEKESDNVIDTLKIIEPTEEEKIQEENDQKLRSEIKDKKEFIYKRLKALLHHLRGVKLFKNYTEANIKEVDTFEILNTYVFNQKMDLYDLMSRDYHGIEIKLQALIYVFEENNVIDVNPSRVSHYLLALNLRSILEESAQLRYIFYKGDISKIIPLDFDVVGYVPLDFDKYSLKYVSDATTLMRMKSISLDKVAKDPYSRHKTDQWLNNVKYISTLINNTLPNEYSDLYSKLCKYSHNSILDFYLEDVLDLLVDTENMIIPLLKEFNCIYNFYFSDDLDKLEKQKNKKIKQNKTN